MIKLKTFKTIIEGDKQVVAVKLDTKEPVIGEYMAIISALINDMTKRKLGTKNMVINMLNKM